MIVEEGRGPIPLDTLLRQTTQLGGHRRAVRYAARGAGGGVEGEIELLADSISTMLRDRIDMDFRRVLSYQEAFEQSKLTLGKLKRAESNDEESNANGKDSNFRLTLEEIHDPSRIWVGAVGENVGEELGYLRNCLDGLNIGYNSDLGELAAFILGGRQVLQSHFEFLKGVISYTAYRIGEQHRKTGRLEVNHPYHVARTASRIHYDPLAPIKALFHDVFENELKSEKDSWKGEGKFPWEQQKARLLADLEEDILGNEDKVGLNSLCGRPLGESKVNEIIEDLSALIRNPETSYKDYLSGNDEIPGLNNRQLLLKICDRYENMVEMSEVIDYSALQMLGLLVRDLRKRDVVKGKPLSSLIRVSKSAGNLASLVNKRPLSFPKYLFREREPNFDPVWKLQNYAKAFEILKASGAALYRHSSGEEIVPVEHIKRIYNASNELIETTLKKIGEDLDLKLKYLMKNEKDRIVYNAAFHLYQQLGGMDCITPEGMLQVFAKILGGDKEAAQEYAHSPNLQYSYLIAFEIIFRRLHERWHHFGNKATDENEDFPYNPFHVQPCIPSATPEATRSMIVGLDSILYKDMSPRQFRSRFKGFIRENKDSLKGAIRDEFKRFEKYL